MTLCLCDHDEAATCDGHGAWPCVCRGDCPECVCDGTRPCECVVCEAALAPEAA